MIFLWKNRGCSVWCEWRYALERMKGVPLLVAALLYGTGLRLLECLRLRVKEIDFDRGEILVRDGKGRTDRRTMLPQRVREPLPEPGGRAGVRLVRQTRWRFKKPVASYPASDSRTKSSWWVIYDQRKSPKMTKEASVNVAKVLQQNALYRKWHPIRRRFGRAAFARITLRSM